MRNEARRTLVNWVGCTVGGSRHEAVDVAIAALAPFSGPAQAGKFLSLAAGVLSESEARTLLGRCWEVEALGNAGDLATAARPA